MQLRLIFGMKLKSWAWVKSFCAVSMPVFSSSGEVQEYIQIAYETYRRAVVRRFPYVVFYEHSDTTVVIYAVFHCSQNPKKWRGRLP